MRESDGDADVDSVNVGDADCEGDAEKDDESDERALKLDDADCETDGVYVPLRVDVEDDVVVCVGDALWVAHAVMDGESVTVTEGVAHALLETDNVPDDEYVGDIDDEAVDVALPDVLGNKVAEMETVEEADGHVVTDAVGESVADTLADGVDESERELVDEPEKVVDTVGVADETSESVAE